MNNGGLASMYGLAGKPSREYRYIVIVHYNDKVVA